MPAADATHALNGIFDGLTGFSRVAVAVSGGSDSMALLRLVSEWHMQPRGPREVVVLTVDHGLRQGSAEEATQVAAWCAALQLSHFILPWSGDKPSTGIQAKARDARYDLMTTWCREARVPVLMTAHTADDQAETVFMRQQRTSSDKSLAGIWPENEWRGIKLLRPLLQVRREALRDYLRELGQGWLEDPSNDNPTFERVRVRQSLSPQDIAPLRGIAEAAQLKVRNAEEELSTWLSLHMIVDEYAVLRLPRLHLLTAQPELQLGILGWAVQRAGDGTASERALVENLLHWIVAGRESRRSLNGAIVSARKHVIELMREPFRVKDRWRNVTDSAPLVFDGRFTVIAPPGSQLGPMGHPPVLKRPKEVPAFAFSALPVVKLADGTMVSAVKSGRPDISATLCERFSL